MPSDKKIEGILMPIPVAFKRDGAIDQAATDAIIDFYLDAGVHGFFPLGTHGRSVFCELMRLRGLPVERFPRWETPPFTEKDRAELKEGIAKTGFAL